ncbi:snoRNA-binding rRNA-processing protein [Martiniozyma asiatica (nom. inval.)]|nr:snoRNA-binding rRNA-processing protein [Martiniozyma asiatica]
MSDRSRHNLEKSVPELQDLLKKGLFTKPELTMIMRRRTDYEHRITGRGSTPSDYIQYADYEKHLERLRRKRYSRYRLSESFDTTTSVSDWAGKRRILYIYSRAVNRYPQEMKIWIDYLKFARKYAPITKVYEIYSQLLKLMPRGVDVWLSAAKWEMESNRNVKGAREVFKRCLRFNGDESRVWIEFIGFELGYLSRLLVRREVLGLVNEKEQLDDMRDVAIAEGKQDENSDLNETGGMFGEVSNEELKLELNQLPEMNVNMLGSIENNPVLKGDLIMTLYDVAIETLTNPKIQVDGHILSEAELSIKKETIVENFANNVLKMIDNYDMLDRVHLCDHVISDLANRYPNNVQGLVYKLTLSMRYVKIEQSDFVAQLQTSVKLFQTWLKKSNVLSECKLQTQRGFVNFLNAYVNEADGEVKQLLEGLVKKMEI